MFDFVIKKVDVQSIKDGMVYFCFSRVTKTKGNMCLFYMIYSSRCTDIPWPVMWRRYKLKGNSILKMMMKDTSRKICFCWSFMNGKIKYKVINYFTCSNVTLTSGISFWKKCYHIRLRYFIENFYCLLDIMNWQEKLIVGDEN